MAANKLQQTIVGKPHMRPQYPFDDHRFDDTLISADAISFCRLIERHRMPVAWQHAFDAIQERHFSGTMTGAFKTPAFLTSIDA